VQNFHFHLIIKRIQSMGGGAAPYSPWTRHRLSESQLPARQPFVAISGWQLGSGVSTIRTLPGDKQAIWWGMDVGRRPPTKSRDKAAMEFGSFAPETGNERAYVPVGFATGAAKGSACYAPRCQHTDKIVQESGNYMLWEITDNPAHRQTYTTKVAYW